MRHIVWLWEARETVSITSESARRGFKARHRNCKALLHPSATNKERRRDRGREKTETASARTAESSSLALSRLHVGRCTYASGKVAIKILRKRYHTACRAGTAFILARRAQCDCVGLVRLGEHPTVTSVALSLSLCPRSQNISTTLSLRFSCV